MNKMNWRDYLLALLSLSLCICGLNKCLKGFRRTQGSGTRKQYLYLLGMIPLLAIIALVLLVVLFEFLGPFH